MLKQRVLTSVLLAPLAIASIIFLPLPFFIVFITLLVLLGFWEWRRFVATESSNAVFVTAALSTFAALYFLLPLSNAGNDLSSLAASTGFLAVGGLWWLVTAGMVKTYPKATKCWEKNSFLQQVFGLLTLLPFLASVLLLRAYEYGETPYLGAKLVLLVCVLVWAADTGAYFAGRAFGKHKLAPNVSPNKTMEGFIGGLVAAVLAMLLFVQIFSVPFSSFLMMVFVAVITSLASVIGDLAESMFKRVAGIKDSGYILPGHGGILDRIDSLTAAFPVFALLYFTLA